MRTNGDVCECGLWRTAQIHLHATSLFGSGSISFLHQPSCSPVHFGTNQPNINVSDDRMGVAKTSRPGTGSPLLQHLLALECGGGLAPSPECPGPCNSPRAPRLQASTVPGYDGGAMLVSPLPPPTPCPSKLEAGAALLQPGVQPQASKRHPLVRRQALPRPSSNERIRTPQHFLPGCHGGPEGRITADCPPTPTHHYPILLQLSTTPTKYCATPRGRGQGRRGACDVIFRSPPAPPEPGSSASCCWRNDSYLVSTRRDIFPQRPRPHRVPPFLAPFIPPAD